MVKRVSCREAGYDCDFSVQSENEDEFVGFVQEHATKTHDTELSSEAVLGLTVAV